MTDITDDNESEYHGSKFATGSLMSISDNIMGVVVDNIITYHKNVKVVVIATYMTSIDQPNFKYLVHEFTNPDSFAYHDIVIVTLCQPGSDDVQEKLTMMHHDIVTSNEHNSPSKLYVVPTDNEGYDFGQWYKVLSRISSIKNKISDITLINDSIILIKSMNNLYKWGDKEDCDSWGLTASTESKYYHIQSYHRVIKTRRAIDSLFEYTETEMKDILSKTYGYIGDLKMFVVNNLEIGISQWFNKKDISQKGRFNSCKPINPSCDCWMSFIESNDFPLLKKKRTGEGTNYILRNTDKTLKDSVFGLLNFFPTKTTPRCVRVAKATPRCVRVAKATPRCVRVAKAAHILNNKRIIAHMKRRG